MFPAAPPNRVAIGLAACVGLAIATLLAGSAMSGPTANEARAAGPASVAATTVNSYGGQSGTPSSLLLTGSPGDSDVEVRLGAGGETFLVADPGGVDAGEDCEQLDELLAKCVRISPGQGVRAALRAGDDRLHLRGPGVTGARIGGGSGQDELVGGPAADQLVGEWGSDRLRGRQGPDRLFGLDGHDWFFGRRGPDRLRADDGHRDETIRCGRGREDVAIVDNKDPQPRGCETVRYR